MNSERGNSREPREEESHILERTRHLQTDQRRLASVCNRLLSTASGCSSCFVTHNLPVLPLFFRSRPQVQRRPLCITKTLNGVGAVNQHELGNLPPASPHWAFTQISRGDREHRRIVCLSCCYGACLRAADNWLRFLSNRQGSKGWQTVHGVGNAWCVREGVGCELRPYLDCVKCCKQDQKAGQKEFGEACENKILDEFHFEKGKKKKNLISCLTSVILASIKGKKRNTRFQHIFIRTTKCSTGKHPYVYRCWTDVYQTSSI